MSTSDPIARDRVADAELQRFLLLLGSAMTTAGEAVNEIERHLRAVATQYGAPEARVAILPTFVVVALDPTRPTTLEPTEQLRGNLRLDQITKIYEVLDQGRRGVVDPAEGSRQVLDILAMPSRYGAVTVVIAHILLSIGICLVLQPSWSDVALAAVFGAMVGVLKYMGGLWLRAQVVMPAAAALLVSVCTFWLAEHGLGEADLRAMIAPLVTFLPGAALTIAVIELSSAQIVTGASRLVAGALQLVLLAVGIVAGTQLVDVPSSSVLANDPQNLLGWWAPSVGVVVFGIGVYVYYSAPRRTFGWLFLVLLAAWIGQVAGSALLGGSFGGFIGGLAMTVAARIAQRLPGGPPALVSFLPAFWLLVPGAIGLIGLTELLSRDTSQAIEDAVGAVAAIVAIALGVLCGYIVDDTATRGYRIIRDPAVYWPTRPDKDDAEP